MNVLILDDSLTVRMDLDAVFRAGGFGTTLCRTVAEARRAIARDRHALVVLDVQLPDGSGVDLLAELRADPATAATPVMLLSTEAAVGDRIRGLAVGANDYIGKPYDAAYVLARARELVSRPNAGERPRPLVLVIDDSPTFRAALADALTAAGYAVRTAASGEEGLQVASFDRPNAIVVDGVLPGIDGRTVLRRIREDGALRRTPCVLLTGSDAAQDEIAALDAGADAYVRKSDDIRLVIARLAALLRAADAPDAHAETRSAMGAKKLLVVDPRPDGLQAMSAAWAADGYDWAVAGSIDEALALLAVQPVDCLLVATALADGSGAAACRRIKADEAWRDIPLILFADTDHAGAMIDGLNAGADDFIVRSEPDTVIRSRVRAQLRRKHLEDENRHLREQRLRQALLADLEAKNAELEEARARAEAATRAKSEFLAHMSHEIRTPLGALIGAADLLELTGLSDDQRRYVEILRHGGDHLLAIVNDILDLSKLEAGSLTLERAPFDLRRLIARLLEAEALRARDKGLALVSWLPGEGPWPVVGDAHRLSQVLQNLLANAIKFTPHGEVSLTVEPAPLGEGPPGAMRFSVADTGIGLNEAKLESIFEAFSQADSATTRQYGGTGLGLAICRRLVQAMGGRIWAERRPAGGSVFRFTVALPDADAAERLIETAAPPAPSPDAEAHGLRILLAEDTPDNRLIFAAFLADTPHRLEMVEDGHQALARFQAERYDVVLMDMQMPGMDGYAATRAIRAWEAAQGRAPTPIVALTAFAMREELARTSEAGCTAHLTKPIKRETLLRAIEALAGFEATDHAEVALDVHLAPLVPEFLAGRREDLDAVRTALGDRRWSAIAEAGHRLTGVGGTYGFDRISELGTVLYGAAARQDAEAVREASESLERYLDTVRVRYVDEGA
jgi:DNA-binding response OmpR family regulator